MKVLVTGVGGQLGHDVINELRSRYITAIGTDILPLCKNCSMYTPLDITDEHAVEVVVEALRPDVIIHCAAWTAVDAAEDPKNFDKVMTINELGTKYLAKAAKTIDAKMVYISSDYVFNGQGTTPWDPDSKDLAPLNVYGQSKLKGEMAVRELLDKFFIVRTAWVFGLNGGNFVKTMLKVAETHPTIRVVNDQIGTPTYTFDLARLLVDMIMTTNYGTYHATNEGGYISWYDFACEIFKQSPEYKTKVEPVTTEEYGMTNAKRPVNSRLEKSKLKKFDFMPLPHWKDALSRYLNALKCK